MSSISFRIYPRDTRRTRKLESTVYIVHPVTYRTVRGLWLAAGGRKPEVNAVLLAKDFQESLKFTNYYVEVATGSQRRRQGAILTQFSKVWGIFNIDTVPPEGEDAAVPADAFTEEDLIGSAAIALSSEMTAAKPVEGFSMAPPPALMAGMSSVSPSKSTEPSEFLEHRYFKALYEQQTVATPLEYFTKSALPKVHILSQDDAQTKKVLSNLMVKSVTDFDKRHGFARIEDEGFDLSQFEQRWMGEEVLLADSEVPFRQSFLDSIAKLGMDKFTGALKRLKVRDAKLQILIGLELLFLLKDDPATASKENGSPRQHRTLRPKLVGRKKRLVPTFIGTVVPLQQPTQAPSDAPLTHKTLAALIKTLFDRLCVWDAILGVSEKNDVSSFNFLKTSVIPYFAKKHHRLLKELVKRSKGVSPRAHHHSSHSSRSSRSTHSSQHSSSHTSRKTSRQSSVSSTGSEVRPRLVRSQKSGGGVGGLASNNFRLKRTSSSFASKEDLAKKTFEMVKTTSFRHQSNQSNQPNQPLSQSLSQPAPEPFDILAGQQDSIFTHGRKRRLVAPNEQAAEGQQKEVTEIAATPAKKRVVDMVTVIEKSPELSTTISQSPDRVSVESPVKRITVLDSSPIITRESITSISSSPIKQPPTQTQPQPQSQPQTQTQSSDGARRRLQFQ